MFDQKRYEDVLSICVIASSDADALRMINSR
jgi:hypothetical protein